MSKVNYNMVVVKKLNINTVKRKKISLSRILLYIFLITLSFICIFPFYILLVNSTHSIDDLSWGFHLLPGSEFLNNYRRLIFTMPVWTGFKNSLITAIPATLLSAYFGSLTAFAFAKYNFKAKKTLFYLTIMALILPPQFGIIGFYKVCATLNIRDTLLPLIIPAIATSGFVIFVRYYIQSNVSDSVIDSARIDGCSEFKIFYIIVLPLIIPAIVTMSILTFVTNWNNFIIPYTVFENDSLYTLQVWTTFSKGLYGNDYGATYCCMALSIILVTIVFFILSKFMISGLTSGIVKE